MWPKLSSKDILPFFWISFIQIVSFGASVGQEASITTAVFFSSIMFILIATFYFKDRILSQLTEGTVLLYNLFVLWICFETNFFQTEIGLIITSLVVLSFLFLFFVCLSPKKLSSHVQIISVVLFLIFNIIGTIFFLFSTNSIGYFLPGYIFNYTSIFYVMTLGFIMFELISNIFHILGLAPIPIHKQETFEMRMRDVKFHLDKLKSSYINTNISIIKTFTVLCLFILLMINTFFQIGFDTTALSVFVLFIGTMFTKEDVFFAKKEDVPKLPERNVMGLKLFLISILLFFLVLPFLAYGISKKVDLTLFDRPVVRNNSFTSSPSVVSNQFSQIDMLMNYGLDAYRATNYSLAENYFIQVLDLDRHNKYAYNNLGLVYFFQNRIYEAKELFLKAIEIDNNYANAHNNLGRLYLNIQEWDSAIYHLNIAIELNPRSQTYASLGEVYVSMGNDLEALRFYQKALDLDPQNKDIEQVINMMQSR